MQTNFRDLLGGRAAIIAAVSVLLLLLICTAVVIQFGEYYFSQSHPVVLVIQDSDHRSYTDPIPVNFATRPPGENPLQITSVLDAEKEGVSVDEVLADWVAL